MYPVQKWYQFRRSLASSGWDRAVPSQRNVHTSIRESLCLAIIEATFEPGDRTRGANDNMLHARQGLHAFFRAYYYYKSADWKGNRPFALKGWTAPELAKMPTYYIMDLNKGMAQTAAEQMPSEQEVAACRWLTDEHLSVYADEYARTGFQGGLQWYRCLTGKYVSELETFSGRTIDVPACFIAGRSDWGIYQVPGALERMETTACTQWRGTHLVDGAGHWVQQEQPETASRLLLQFIAD